MEHSEKATTRERERERAEIHNGNMEKERKRKLRAKEKRNKETFRDLPDPTIPRNSCIAWFSLYDIQ